MSRRCRKAWGQKEENKQWLCRWPLRVQKEQCNSEGERMEHQVQYVANRLNKKGSGRQGCHVPHHCVRERINGATCCPTRANREFQILKQERSRATAMKRRSGHTQWNYQPKTILEPLSSSTTVDWQEDGSKGQKKHQHKHRYPPSSIRFPNKAFVFSWNVGTSEKRKKKEGKQTWLWGAKMEKLLAGNQTN